MCFPLLQRFYLGLVALVLVAGLAVSNFTTTGGGSQAAEEHASRIRLRCFVAVILVGILVALHWWATSLPTREPMPPINRGVSD